MLALRATATMSRSRCVRVRGPSTHPSSCARARPSARAPRRYDAIPTGSNGMRSGPVLISAPSQEHFQPRPSLHHLLDDALPPLSRPRGAQHAVRPGCCAFGLSVFLPRYGSLCCFGCPQVQGRRPRGRARSWRASSRGHRDRDDGRQDAEGGGAEQHRLDFFGCLTGLHAAEPSGNVRISLHRCSSAPSPRPSCPSCRASRPGGFRRRHQHGGASTWRLVDLSTTLLPYNQPNIPF